MLQLLMNEQNPYDSPEDLTIQSSSETRPTKAVISRVVEYAIAIILIIALLSLFVPIVHGNTTGTMWP